MEHEVSFLSFLLFQLCVVYGKGHGNIYYYLLYVLRSHYILQVTQTVSLVYYYLNVAEALSKALSN